MMPSSPWAREASSRAAPSPRWCAGVCQRSPCRPSASSRSRRSRYVHQRVPVEPQQVEDQVRDGVGGRQPPHGVLGGQVHAALELLEARTAGVVERHHLAVEDRLAPGQRPPELAQLGVAGRDVVPVAALEPQPAALGVADRPHAVPLDLVRPALVVGGQVAEAGEHRLDLLRHRLPSRVLGRVHPVDHPVLAAGAEEDVAALQALAVEGDHHLVLAELVLLVRAAVPDPHRPRAVLAGRDLAVEVEVLERMVLGADREVVAAGVGRDALRHRPRGEHAVVLQPQVPVQRAGVVLLHDEPRGAPVRLLGSATRLGGG
jgi:hypothetical protein